MIRNPFKKAFSSRKTKQEDVQFEAEVQKLHHMQSASKRLYKGMTKCLESESAQARANAKIFSDLHSSPSSKTEPLKSIVDSAGSCFDELQSHSKEHKSRQEIVFSDPIKRFHNVYKHIDVHIKQRDARLQELERQQGKLEKRQASQSAKLELTQRKLSSAKSEFEKINSQLMTELPQLHEKRVDVFDPCLKAMMSSELLYHQNCANTLRDCLESIKSQLATPEKAEDGKGDKNDNCPTLDDIFSQIKSLSIVGET
ncbi:PREDICTED: bridging integrator 3-like [Amphimedon queenslandica]|uniref:BAR domain-containing protein n=1 Tax=Amphimedon queenslandica TaxID=400682 RepID=A0A1X7VK00_AMPQE|nr:PREDICTED: bridging integrator 3-like [Amphimedon queenslandica]XP_019864388.1 PREDICTED: bridging integrator 3-like [Amphimedon queenslandica]|eukprot:XP_019864387.1 PREDICTED: bridging integrator 3-like [Amphimedon queenslandica]